LNRRVNNPVAQCISSLLSLWPSQTQSCSKHPSIRSSISTTLLQHAKRQSEHACWERRGRRKKRLPKEKNRKRTPFKQSIPACSSACTFFVESQVQVLQYGKANLQGKSKNSLLRSLVFVGSLFDVFLQIFVRSPSPSALTQEEGRCFLYSVFICVLFSFAPSSRFLHKESVYPAPPKVTTHRKKTQKAPDPLTESEKRVSLTHTTKLPKIVHSIIH